MTKFIIIKNHKRMVFRTSHLTASLNNLIGSPPIHFGLLVCIFITLVHLPNKESLDAFPVSLRHIKVALVFQLCFHIASIVSYLYKELCMDEKKRGGYIEGLLVIFMLIGFVMMGSNLMNIV